MTFFKSLSEMHSLMFGARHELKIFYAIVMSIAIFVMDYYIKWKFLSKVSFHYMTMQILLFTIYSSLQVSFAIFCRRIGADMFSMTFSRTIKTYFQSTWIYMALFATVFTKSFYIFCSSFLAAEASPIAWITAKLRVFSKWEVFFADFTNNVHEFAFNMNLNRKKGYL